MAGNNNGRLTNAIGESLSPAAIKLTVPAGAFRAAGTRARERLSLPRRGRAQVRDRKRQTRDRSHGGGNHGGVVSPQRNRRLARTRQAALEPRPSGVPLRWHHPDTGNAGAITPARAYKSAGGIYCREYQLTVPPPPPPPTPPPPPPPRGCIGQAHGSTWRQPGGSWRVSNQHRVCPWRPARRSNGGDRFNCPCTIQPFRPHPVPSRRRERELEPKAGEGGCRKGCPRPVPHSPNPGDRYARPRTRYL